MLTEEMLKIWNHQGGPFCKNTEVINARFQMAFVQVVGDINGTISFEDATKTWDDLFLNFFVSVPDEDSINYSLQKLNLTKGQKMKLKEYQSFSIEAIYYFTLEK